MNINNKFMQVCDYYFFNCHDVPRPENRVEDYLLAAGLVSYLALNLGVLAGLYHFNEKQNDLRTDKRNFMSKFTLKGPGEVTKIENEIFYYQICSATAIALFCLSTIGISAFSLSIA